MCVSKSHCAGSRRLVCSPCFGELARQSKHAADLQLEGYLLRSISVVAELLSGPQHVQRLGEPQLFLEPKRKCQHWWEEKSGVPRFLGSTGDQRNVLEMRYLRGGRGELREKILRGGDLVRQSVGLGVFTSTEMIDET